MAKHLEKTRYTTLEVVTEIWRSSDEEENDEDVPLCAAGSDASSVDSEDESNFLEGKDPDFEL